MEELVSLFKIYYGGKEGEPGYAQYLERPIARGEKWSIETAFINLALLMQQDAEKARKEIHTVGLIEDFVWHDAQVNNSERIYESKKSIEMNDIFKPSSGDQYKSPKKIVLVGAAGTGKSTFAQRIAYDWGSNNAERPFALPDVHHPFQLVIWIRLRDLVQFFSEKKENLDAESFGLCSFLVEKFPQKLRRVLTKKEITPESMAELLWENDDKILYLVDGYDEIISLPKEHRVWSVFEKFLLKQVNLLLTTRPHYEVAVPENLTKSHFRYIELLGFRFEDSIAYVEKHFEENKEVLGYKTLKNLLETNKSLRGLAHIPVNVEILCTLMMYEEQEILSTLKVSTMTHLYEEMIFFLLKRHFVKQLHGFGRDRLADKASVLHCFESEGLLEILGGLSFQGLSQRKLIFRAEEIKKEVRKYVSREKTERVLFKQLFDTELMRGFVWEEDLSDFKGQGEFLHLTFQEYLAAWWYKKKFNPGFSHSPDVSAEQLLSFYKYRPAYSMVWPFVAGLLALEQETREESLKYFFELVTSHPYLIMGYGYDVFILRCLEQTSVVAFPFKEEFLEKIKALLQNVLLHENPALSSSDTIYITVLKQCNWVMQYYQAVFVDALHSPEKNKRWRAAIVVGEIGIAAGLPEIEQSLYVLLKEEEWEISISAALALSQLDSKFLSETIEILFRWLRSKNKLAGIAAVSALGRLGLAAATTPVVQELLSVLFDEDGNLAAKAAEVLGTFCVSIDLESVVNELVKTLSHSEEYRVAAAAHTLGELGPAVLKVNSSVLNILQEKMLDTRWLVKYRAVQAVLKFGYAVTNENTINHLINLLENDMDYVRGTIAYLLGELGKIVENPNLKRRIKDALQGVQRKEGDIWTCSNALDALSRLGTREVTRVHVKNLFELFCRQQLDKIKSAVTSDKFLFDHENEPDWLSIYRKFEPDKVLELQKIDDKEASLSSEGTQVTVPVYWPLLGETTLFYLYSKLKEDILQNELLDLLINFFCKEENDIKLSDIKSYFEFMYRIFDFLGMTPENIVLPKTVYGPSTLYDLLTEWCTVYSTLTPPWFCALLLDSFNSLQPSVTLQACASDEVSEEPTYCAGIMLRQGNLFEKDFILTQPQANTLITIARQLKKNPVAQFASLFLERERARPLPQRLIKHSARRSAKDIYKEQQDLSQAQLLSMDSSLKQVLSHSVTAKKIIFISRAWPLPPEEDKWDEWWTGQFADTLAEHLERLGFEVIIDKKNLGVGVHLPSAMEWAVKKADHVLILITHTYLYKIKESPLSGVATELNFIRQRIYEMGGATVAGEKRFVLPFSFVEGASLSAFPLVESFSGFAAIYFKQMGYLNAILEVPKKLYQLAYVSPQFSPRLSIFVDPSSIEKPESSLRMASGMRNH